MATTMEPDVEQQRPSRATPAKSTPADERPAAPGGRRRIVFAILGLALLVLIAGGVRKLIWARSHEASDNAQVDGHILPVLPKVGGFVTAVRVEENQPVRAGDTLVVIDPRDYQVRLQQADADLGVALATVSSRQRVGQADAAVRQADAVIAHRQVHAASGVGVEFDHDFARRPARERVLDRVHDRLAHGDAEEDRLVEAAFQGGAPRERIEGALALLRHHQDVVGKAIARVKLELDAVALVVLAAVASTM